MAGIPAGMESDEYSDEDDFLLKDYSGREFKSFSNGPLSSDGGEIHNSDSFGNVVSHGHNVKQMESKESILSVGNNRCDAEEECLQRSKTELVSNSSLFSVLSQKKAEAVSRDEISLDVENVRMAIVRGNTEYVREALQAGFSANTCMKSGWSPLMYAANGGYQDIISLLVDAGASPKFESDMFTPMMALCTSSKTKEDDLIASADELLIACCDVNRQDRHKMTPLMYAAQNGRARLVEFLANRNAAVNKQDSRGWTALAFAADKGYAHVCKSLLMKGADPKLSAYDGQSPADLAYAAGFLSLSEMLEGSIEEVSQKFKEEAMTGTKAARSSPIKKTSKYVQYGNLEVFLSGIDLTHLIPLFHDHQVTFPMLLKMGNEDLLEIGIDQYGVRKKLLEAIRSVHKNEWDLSSLDKAKLNKLSTVEASTIIANVSSHLLHIQSSVEYVERYLDFAKDQIRQSDQSVQRTLCEQCTEASENALQLATSLKRLETSAVKNFPVALMKPADAIQLIGEDRCQWKRHHYILAGGVACIFGAGIISGVIYVLDR